MQHYIYRQMADVHYEEEIAEDKPWFEVVLVDPGANVIMPAEDDFRNLTESDAKAIVEKLNIGV